MISSFSGACLGDGGWGDIKRQTNGYLLLFMWGLEGAFSQWPSMDSWLRYVHLVEEPAIASVHFSAVGEALFPKTTRIRTCVQCYWSDKPQY